MVSVSKHHAATYGVLRASTLARLSKSGWRSAPKFHFLDISNPTRPAGATDSLQSIVYLSAASLFTALRASGIDGVFVRTFIENDQDRLIYRAAPLPMDISLESAVHKAAFFGDKSFGVVPFALGFGIRVNTLDYIYILNQIQPVDAGQFIGNRWEISGLPLAMGKESLQHFVGGWHVTPLHTFRHGFRRTWIVRAASDPVETIIPHDFGVAVIKAAVAKRPVVTTERFQAPLRSSATFVRESMSNYPKSWAGVVAGVADQPTAVVPKKSGSDGAIAASAVQAAPRTQLLFPARAPAEAHKPAIHPVAHSSALAAQLSPMDFASMMAATIEAALTPLREKLNATIGPMQRTLESLQAEFVAIREEKCDEAMQQAVSGAVPETQEATRLRTGNGA